MVFQPADWTQPVIYYDPTSDGPFVEWVWSHLVIDELTFTNTLDKRVNLIIRAGDSHSKAIVSEAILAQIAAEETVTFKPMEVGAALHAGDTIVAVDDEDNVVNRYLLDTVTTKYDITQSDDQQVLDDAKYTKMMADKVKLRDSRDWYVDSHIFGENVFCLRFRKIKKLNFSFYIILHFRSDSVLAICTVSIQQEYAETVSQ